METGEYPAMSHHPIEKQKNCCKLKQQGPNTTIAKLFEEARSDQRNSEDESLTPVKN